MRNRLLPFIGLFVHAAALLTSAEYQSRRIIEPWYYAFDFYGMGGIPYIKIDGKRDWGDGVMSIDPAGIYFPRKTKTLIGFVFNYAMVLSTDEYAISQYSLSASIVRNFRRIGDGYFLRADAGPALLHNPDWGTSPAGLFGGARCLVALGRAWAVSKGTSIQMQLVGTWTLANHFSYGTVSLRLGLLL